MPFSLRKMSQPKKTKKTAIKTLFILDLKHIFIYYE